MPLYSNAMLTRFCCVLVLAGCCGTTFCACASSATVTSANSPGHSAYQRPTDLTGWELQRYDEYLLRFDSPCGGGETGETIATCLEKTGMCRSCIAAASFVASSIRAGFVPSQIEARYKARFDPEYVQQIDLQGAPVRGPDDASVTIVIFADFQCPACGAIAEPLHKVLETYAPNVRLVFKDYPIKYHQQAEGAAWAGVAAHKQGKFWPLHDLMFANAEKLQPHDIETYARSLNLDMTKFTKDRDSAETKATVLASFQQGSRLGVKGTPALFINGRAFDVDLFSLSGEDLVAWIETEIELKKGTSDTSKSQASTAVKGDE